MFFNSTGILKYSDNPYKLVVDVDEETSRYYRSLIPKYYCVAPQKYSAHISVVRKENPINIQNWNKYQGKLIQFSYENIIYNDEVYFWLNVFSQELEDIRVELGLESTSILTKSPDGKHKFHSTIGNIKHLNGNF